MQWLNPMNWIKLLTLLKEFWGWASSIYKTIQEAALKKKQQKKVEQTEKAETALEEANKIEDEEERLRKKAEAACEMEKSLNPNSDCDRDIRK